MMQRSMGGYPDLSGEKLTASSGAVLTWLHRGIERFSAIERAKSRVSYGEWVEALGERWPVSPGDDDPLARCWLAHGSELHVWMWKSLLAMPGYGAQARRAVAVHREAKYREVLFEPGAEFIVSMGAGSGETLYPGEYGRALVLVQTLDELAMTKGKSGFLECEPVRCLVWIPVRDPQSLEREQTSLGVAVEDVAVFSHVVRGSVGSLSQASAVASRRLAPHRRAHVGNIYQRVSWTDRRRAVTLKSIREAVHDCTWSSIDDTPGLVEQHIHGLNEGDRDGPPWPCRRDGSVAPPPPPDPPPPSRR